jgi:hypothetical protein
MREKHPFIIKDSNSRQQQARCERPRLKPLKHEFHLIFKNSVPASQKTHCVSITKTVQFSEKTAVYSENHIKDINTLCRQNS